MYGLTQINFRATLTTTADQYISFGIVVNTN